MPDHNIYVPPRRMPIPEVVLIQNHEDWEALYVNGKKVEEGHRISIEEAFAAIGIKIETRSVEPSEEMNAFQDSI